MSEGFLPFADPSIEDLYQVKDLRDLQYLLGPVYERIIKLSDQKGINLEKYDFLDVTLDGYNEEVSEYSCGFSLKDSDPDFPVPELEFFVTFKNNEICKSRVKLESYEMPF